MVDKLARIVHIYIKINIHLCWTIWAKMSIYDPLTKIPENVLLTNLGQYVYMDKLDITTISV